jgi:hypothetical protein
MPLKTSGESCGNCQLNSRAKNHFNISTCKEIEHIRQTVPWRMLAVTVGSSPYNEGPTKLIKTQGMNSRKGFKL